jgi:hypothetical protein
VVPLPLLAGDLPPALHLQQALHVVYDILGYDKLIDYHRLGPLTPTEPPGL